MPDGDAIRRPLVRHRRGQRRAFVRRHARDAAQRRSAAIWLTRCARAARSARFAGGPRLSPGARDRRQRRAHRRAGADHGAGGRYQAWRSRSIRSPAPTRSWSMPARGPGRSAGQRPDRSGRVPSREARRRVLLGERRRREHRGAAAVDADLGGQLRDAGGAVDRHRAPLRRAAGRRVVPRRHGGSGSSSRARSPLRSQAANVVAMTEKSEVESPKSSGRGRTSPRCCPIRCRRRRSTSTSNCSKRGERAFFGRLMAPASELGPIVKAFHGRLYFNLSQLRRVTETVGAAPADMLRSLGHPEADSARRRNRQAAAARPAAARAARSVAPGRQHPARGAHVSASTSAHTRTAAAHGSPSIRARCVRPRHRRDVRLVDRAKRRRR